MTTVDWYLLVTASNGLFDGKALTLSTPPTRTARSRGERTNHEATAPPQDKKKIACILTANVDRYLTEFCRALQAL